METSRPHLRIVSSEGVEGATVYDGVGRKIGKIDHLVIEKITGKVLYAVVNVMGFLGLGHCHREIPWAALHYDTRLNGFRTDLQHKHAN
jgi:hypothetical protein